MVHLLSIVQLTLAVLLIGLILLQRANTDASGALGAEGGSGAVLEKRGGEKFLHRMTFVVAVAFVVALGLPLFLN